MRTKEIVGAILALTLFLGIAPFALTDAPGTPFEVGGHVYLDTTPVSGAAVTVTNQDTGESLTTTTDINGAYVVALGNLPSGHSAGDTIVVTATYSGMTGTSSAPRSESLSDSPQIIDVTLEVAVTITISGPATISLDATAHTFSAICKDANDTVISPCPTLTWHSSNTAVGTITAGEFTALAVGTTTITARADGVTSNEAVVTVNAPEDNETLSNETSFTIESGNANVTGNFSVDVSGDVAVQAVGNVTAHVPDATTVGLGAGYEFISGAIVNVSEDIHNALEGGNDTVTITLCVSDSMLDAMELARSNVQIYVYNEDTEEWVGLTTNRVGTTDCHTADISGYLSEAIVAIASKPASTPPSGGGGGGGSGTYPPGWFGTPTVTATKAPAATTTATAAPPDDKATPAPTKKPAVTKATAPTAEGTTAETAKKSAPGFTAVFAIAGLLAIAYAMMRRRE